MTFLPASARNPSQRAPTAARCCAVPPRYRAEEGCFPIYRYPRLPLRPPLPPFSASRHRVTLVAAVQTQTPHYKYGYARTHALYGCTAENGSFTQFGRESPRSEGCAPPIRLAPFCMFLAERRIICRDNAASGLRIPSITAAMLLLFRLHFKHKRSSGKKGVRPASLFASVLGSHGTVHRVAQRTTRIFKRTDRPCWSTPAKTSRLGVRTYRTNGSSILGHALGSFCHPGAPPRGHVHPWPRRAAVISCPSCCKWPKRKAERRNNTLERRAVYRRTSSGQQTLSRSAQQVCKRSIGRRSGVAA